jgi:hypothetical protein
MPDDRNKRGPQDATRVNVHEPWEVEYWTKELGVSAETLKKAVQSVGPMAKDVRSHLAK